MDISNIIKLISLIIIIGILPFACNKEIFERKDEIVFIDLQPDIEATSIRDYYTNMNPYCGQLPLPNDSIAYIELDLNQDSDVDFIIEVRHYEQELTEYCGHCGIFHIKTIEISPLDTSGYISIDTASNYWIRNYNTTQLITTDDTWSNDDVTALLEDGCMIPHISFDDTYWGLKLGNMIAWLHVERISNNGLRIKEFAYNLTENNSIMPGQKE